MSRTISGATQVLGIIGCPIAHSQSPLMQNTVLRELAIDAVFVPFCVHPEALPGAVAGLKALGVLGFNVTVPHKETILPLLDEVDPDARRIGAVNTVKLEGGRLIGFNTDAPGFIASLQEDLSFTPAGRRVLLLGAGGAARAAVVALGQAGVAALTIANRSPSRAEELCAEFKEWFPHVDMCSSDLSLLGDGPALGGFDLLVNTTSVGLGGTGFPSLQLGAARGLRIYDMVYGASPTPLVLKGLEHGCMAVNGQGMLAAQGERAFTIWFGRVPPPGLMKATLLRAAHIGK